MKDIGKLSFASMFTALILASTLAVAGLAAAPQEALAAPEKGTVSSVAPYTTHQLKVTAKKQSGVSGYTVMYSPYKSFKGYKSVSSTSNTIYVKSLKASTRYYVKVRAYKKNANGTISRGAWSTPKYATTYTYSITYNLNGGTKNAAQRYGFYKSSATFSLKNPTRPYYSFLGWYTTKTFKSGTKVTSIKKGTARNIALYARWKYDYSYDIYGNYAYATYVGNKKSIAPPKTIKGANLVELDCAQKNLTSLDVSKCTALKSLDCSDNALRSLDVSKNIRLEELYCSFNKLSSLDVAKCTELVNLMCPYNFLGTLDLSKNTRLDYLNCAGNGLSSLNVSNCPSLDDIDCYGNNLKSLDVSGCTKLTHLACDDNALTSLDISKCPKMNSLDCSDNALESLDVSGCPGFEWLACSHNNLTSLDFSCCPRLKELSCNDNILVSLDFSDCPMLKWLSCYENNLTSLDVSGCSELFLLCCDEWVSVTGCEESIIERY